MEIDRSKQNSASEQVKKLLQENEEQRAAMRLEKCFRDLIQGNIVTLNNDEIINNLPPFLYALHEDGQHDVVSKVLHTLSDGCCDANRSIRERSIMVVSVFIGIAMQNKTNEFDAAFSEILVRWLKEEQEFLTGFETICNQLQQLVKKELDSSQWVKAENLVIVLYQISAGILKKAGIIKTVVNRTLNQLATEELTGRLLEEYLTPENGNQDVAESLLIHLGVKSLSQLVHALAMEEDAERRYLLLELLPNNEQVYTIMRAHLQGDVPWYVIRNAILIFSRESSEENFKFIREYVDYPDMRVQQQVISGIWKMGGRDMVLRLLDVLLYVDDSLKMQLINQLSQMNKEPVIGLGFVYLLRHRHTFGRISKEELEYRLCEYLGDYPLVEVQEILTQIIEDNMPESQSTSARVIAAARTSLQKVTEVLKNKTSADTYQGHNKVVEGPVGGEKQDLDDLLHLGDDVDDDFLSLDFDLDLDSEDLSFLADSENGTVSSLGEDLLEEDDAFHLILAETMKSGGALLQDDFELEEAQGHISVWSDFYDRLDSDEFNTFYSLLEKKEFQPQQTLVVMGAENPQLILLDEGYVVPVFGEENSRIAVKHLQGGNIIGSASFFGGRRWPFSLVCQDIVRCHVLDRQRCQEHLDRYPAVYEKIKSYCKSHDVMSWLLEMLENTEPAPEKVIVHNLNRKLGGGDTADDLPGEGLCFGAITGGLCIEIKLDKAEQCQDLTAKLVEVVLCDSDDKCTKVFGVIIGWRKNDKDEKVVRILVQFYRHYRAWEFSCRSLTFL